MDGSRTIAFHIYPSLARGIVWTLYYYREELRQFLLRVRAVKVLGTEVTTEPTQQPSTSATKVAETPQSKSERDAEGFYSETGISQLVKDTSPRGETVVGALLFFKTPSQHTWLVATQKKLYCVLDDADQRKTGELVQFTLPLEDAEPITIRGSDKPSYGFVDIGKESYWYYSQDLFPEAAALKSAISQLIVRAKQFAVELPSSP